MSALFFNIVAKLTLVLLFVNLLSYFEGYAYVFEILTHFKLQYFFLFLLSGMFFALFYQRKNAKKWLLLSFLGVSLNTIAIAPTYITPPINTQANTGFSLLLANVLSSNSSKDKFVRLIRKYSANPFD